MFGAEQQEALERRIAELERMVQTLTARADASEARTAPRGEGFEGRLDTLYRAESSGFVAVYFVTGRTAKVQLLVGPHNPLTRVVGVVNSRGSQDSYAGGIVRAGEYWVAASSSRRPNLNFRVHFTPLF
ncbi:hypothetical protein [Amycolatopsis magusensis]|uniref:hypothetical protein n=1 Tax=Amycolatopsis magusensis TaxID=882444 RepID=UPI00378DE335